MAHTFLGHPATSRLHNLLGYIMSMSAEPGVTEELMAIVELVYEVERFNVDAYKDTWEVEQFKGIMERGNNPEIYKPLMDYTETYDGHPPDKLGRWKDRSESFTAFESALKARYRLDEERRRLKLEAKALDEGA